MSENEFEGLPDNEWDDPWELAWSEFDWERYLRDQDRIFQNYLAHYQRLLDRPDRIDEVAHLMGWDEESWTNDESSAEVPPPQSDTAGRALDPATPAEPAPAPLDPYTIQKHPVYIATHALFHWLQFTWEFTAPACGTSLPVRTAVMFPVALARAEHEGMLATHSLDMGDFSLTVAQVKRALVGLNSALKHLEMAGDRTHPAFARFKTQAAIRIFDIREIWLRVMRDCRAEIDRRVGENGA